MSAEWIPNQADVARFQRDLYNAKSRVGDLRERLMRAQEDVAKAEHALAFAQHGTMPGVRVRLTGTTGERWQHRSGTVRAVKYHSWGRPWLMVALDKKDGSPGDKVVCAYSDWELIVPA
jgi:hypothetical protein